jgi:hypothetical protein
MDEITQRRLLLSKRLFSHGVQHSNKNKEIDRFLAIHHFDNAIELFLKIIATKEGILTSKKEDWKFKDLWGVINTKFEQKTSGYVLPLKDQLFGLHETRNSAQHQGDAPSYETIIKYQSYTKDFLNKCFKDIFEIDFDKVYASSLVENIKIKNALIESEKYIDENCFNKAMESSSKAFAYLKLNESDEFLSDKLIRLALFGVLDEHNNHTSSSYSNDKLERQFEKRLDEFDRKIKKQLSERARKINEFARTVEEEFTILNLGVDYKEFKLFERISPYAYFTMGTTEPHIGVRNETNYNEENALFCYEFVLEAALRLQEMTVKEKIEKIN